MGGVVAWEMLSLSMCMEELLWQCLVFDIDESVVELEGCGIVGNV